MSSYSVATYNGGVGMKHIVESPVALSDRVLSLSSCDSYPCLTHG